MILDALKVSPDLEAIRKGLHLAKDKEWQRVCRLVDQVWPLIEPKAVYRDCSVTVKGRDCVEVDRVSLKSRVLRRQVDGAGQVFPYVVTIGKKLEERVRGCDDILKQYYLDTIGNFALSDLLIRLEDHLRSRYGFTCTSSMAPGSLEDWPIGEQGPLFSILGDVKKAIGVSLTEVFLMIPTKSESGIFFPSSEKFYSCRLCPREKCMNRKTPYSEKAALEIGEPS